MEVKGSERRVTSLSSISWEVSVAGWPVFLSTFIFTFLIVGFHFSQYFPPGSVPLMKYSNLVGHFPSGGRPEKAQISLPIMFSGFLGHSTFFPFKTSRIIRFQIGAAPVTPETK